MVAYNISALMASEGLSLKEAAKEVIQNKLPNIEDQGATGGIIVIDKNGNMAMEFNTQGMFRPTMNNTGKLYIGIFKD